MISDFEVDGVVGLLCVLVVRGVGEVRNLEGTLGVYRLLDGYVGTVVEFLLRPTSESGGPVSAAAPVFG